MRFECNINMDNDAFAQDMHLELCHTLKILTNKIRDYDNVVRSATLRDTNGNKIGTWKIIGDNNND